MQYETLYRFSILVIFFSVHAFFGWVLETVYRSYHAKSFVNAGFLYGPFVPLYGFGALLVYTASFPMEGSPGWIKLPVYAALVTALEYFGSLLMEKRLTLKLWDYSENRFNLHGRVCLSFSLFWAVLAAAQSRWIQPFVLAMLAKLPAEIGFGLSGTLLAYFLADLNLSAKLYKRFSRTLAEALAKVKAADVPDLLRAAFAPRDLHGFLRPLRKFPKLSFRLNRRWDRFSSLVLDRVREWAAEIAASAKDYLPERRTWREDEAFLRIAAPILEHEEYARLKDFRHHDSSIFDHNLNVAYLSYRVGKKLKLREKDLVRGALLHDFFHYDWRTERPENGRKHAWEHPKISLRNARRHFGPLSPVEKDIIARHMWPLSLVPPLYPESFMVMLADKIVASREFAADFVAGLRERK